MWEEKQILNLILTEHLLLLIYSSINQHYKNKCQTKLCPWFMTTNFYVCESIKICIKNYSSFKTAMYKIVCYHCVIKYTETILCFTLTK